MLLHTLFMNITAHCSFAYARTGARYAGIGWIWNLVGRVTASCLRMLTYAEGRWIMAWRRFRFAASFMAPRRRGVHASTYRANIAFVGVGVVVYRGVFAAGAAAQHFIYRARTRLLAAERLCGCLRYLDLMRSSFGAGGSIIAQASPIADLHL